MANGISAKNTIKPPLKPFKKSFSCMKNCLQLLILFSSMLICSDVHAEKACIKRHKDFFRQQKPASDFLRKINALIGPFLSLPPEKQATTRQLTIEWQEAQKKVGIPYDYYIPVYKKSESGLHAWTLKGSLAAVDTNAMYVDEKVMSITDYGSQRKTVLHEAVHQKYLDPLCLKATAVVCALGSSFGVEMIKKPPFLSTTQFNIIKTLIPCGLTYALCKYLSPLIEYRADLEAAYLTNCSECIASSASALKRNPIDFQADYCSKGYLSAQELEEIAHEHARNGALCQYHASRTRNKTVAFNTKPE